MCVCVCASCSVHLCGPQALPWADHYQVCGDEEAGRHRWGGTDPQLRAVFIDVYLNASPASHTAHLTELPWGGR